ncbi:capsular biosynthesis protein [Pelagerythrobacter sp.]|uniref:capsular biosynthesis protein n=1 Tax=Pelagerythrobacter sp. TaxID=2800702 RepID=UPI0035AF2C68
MIVFPMAGLSSRFLKAGYETPKFMLPLWDHFVFDYAAASFRPRFASERFVFIYRETGGVRDFIEARARSLGIADATLVALERETAGQAETVELGLDLASAGAAEPITVFNIDTFRNPDIAVSGLRQDVAGWLEVFRGEGDNWSFVEPAAEPGLVRRTTEKQPISDLCCTGLYQFATADLFRAALAAERKSPNAPELYVAPIYNHLISAGEAIGFGLVERADITFCGVPAEYEELLERPAPYAPGIAPA